MGSAAGKRPKFVSAKRAASPLQGRAATIERTEHWFESKCAFGIVVSLSYATSIGAFTAISMVATPHWGDCSLSIDLTSDEISATGGHQRFALERFALLVSVRKRTRTADGIPVPRAARVRTPPRFRLWRMTHRVTTRIVPHAAVNGLGRDDILGALLCGSHVC